FVFQAEDGIRDFHVTGVQTCALPISADRPERFLKAGAAGADAVIVDLEDAVAPEAKAASRDLLAKGLAAMPQAMPVLLRINGTDTEWHEADIEAARRLPLAAVMVPKAEEPADLHRVADRCGCPVVVLIESAAGLHRAVGIAGASERMAFGSIDFAADLA